MRGENGADFVNGGPPLPNLDEETTSPTVIATTYPNTWAQTINDAHPKPKVGDIWIDQDLKNARLGEDGEVRRREVRILAIDYGRIRVQNIETGRRSWVRSDAFDPPKSARYGYVLHKPFIPRETIDGAVAGA